ncbi:hypothetical protein BCR43DRAFT_486087 [Syncephalastrum racemosum]|uniref:Uncharacterized protein n=1 Tax=Syncephalastrum racemosum TaxID=13706 RepID=A0A1X2HPX0_SYNRA|nr:hypothetical protein BCR43DRAFT_486087 [Syncephalastrum racemosum]
MDKTFAGLLRNSRLASYDRHLPQVYTTPAKRQRVGDWGVKRTLPRVIRSPTLTLEAMDTREHQTPWQSAANQVLFIRRWKENFGGSKVRQNEARAGTNVATMSGHEFRRYLRRVRKTRDAFQEQVVQKALVPEQVYDYLGVTFGKQQHVVVGPTYADLPAAGSVVKGRILNRVPHGYAVGVAGVVALLPSSSVIHMPNHNDRNVVHQFYIDSADIDAGGRPQVTVRLEPSSDVEGILRSINHLTRPTGAQQAAKDESPFATLSADDLFRQDDRTRPNPDHNELIKQFSLLNVQQKK